MVGVDWQAIDVAPDHDAGLLLPLLGAIVAALAEALKVGCIVEQRYITSVRSDVVSDRSGYRQALRSAATAQRLTLQLFPSESVPVLRLVEVMPR